ncbi:ankyrin repeat protein [Legionella massiliensis]|uniref:Ankyrin repeat protein n=1 Tax=Legionella massiliensis TaxID=1034943 RepID=A0A078KVR5_9GAMM|nr:DUF5630 domain-containing protein [Legionella massiliensis]CDZ78520.1 ankyrin repeat protein [Legionella massiliensis]CEE14258.1 Ankyrin repeats (3 copies) [Legionella massiliensis]
MTPLQFEIQLRNYSDNRNDKNLKTLLQTLQSLPLATLNNFCLQNETIRKILREPDFEPFWQKKMEGIKIKGLEGFSFKATQSLNPMDLRLGYFNYIQAIKASMAKNPEEETKYIHQALQFHSFHALNHFYQELLFQFKAHDTESFELTAESIAFFEEEARWHGTPGYLIVAKLYFRLTSDLMEANDSPAAISAAFQLLIKNLKLAELMESESEDDIHNAYLAQPFAQQNPFNLESIAAIRQACISHAGAYLSRDDVNIAIGAAKNFRPTRAKPPVVSEPVAPSDFYQAILTDSSELLRLSYKKEELEKTNHGGETPLFFAIRHGKINCVRCLLALGANPDCSDSRGNKSLALALHLGHQGIAKLLVKAKPELLADSSVIRLNGPDHPHTKALRKIPQKAEIEILMKALKSKSGDKIRGCLQTGIGPDLILPSGKTCLAHLVETNNIKGIELLLEFGVSLNHPNSNGETVLFSLMNAIESKNNSTYFRRFVSLGADLNVQNKQGETLLIRATKGGDLNAVSFLLEQDTIDLTLGDKQGRTALDYATNQWVRDLILEKQAKNPLNEQKQEATIPLTSQIMRFFGFVSDQDSTQPSVAASSYTT